MKTAAILLIGFAAFVFCAYQGLLYYDNNFKYGRMWETPAIRPLEEPALSTPRDIVSQGGSEALFRVTPPEQLNFPQETVRSEHVERGETLYFTFCAQCHGKDLDGNGTVGQSFHPLPTDLRSQKVQSLSDGALFKDISFGTPEGRQPPLAGTIDVPERWSIVAYIKSLGIRD
jgi:mono/diheme cytochrome c family protein